MIPPAKPTSKFGFTVVEMLIVILVMGILAAVSIPRISSSVENYRAELAITKIANDLSFAASHARATQKPVTIEFETATATHSGKYWFAKVIDRLGVQRAVNFSEAPFLVQLNSAPSKITFDIYSYPDRDAVWVINETLPSERSVTINRASGRVVVQ